MGIVLNKNYLKAFIDVGEYEAIYPEVEAAHAVLQSKTGPGSIFLGWADLPNNYDKAEFARIKKCAAKLRNNSDAIVVIGIGGSYLGARAVVEALGGTMFNDVTTGPKIYFAGNNISSSYHKQVLKACEGKRLSVIVISKSGTTTEPALAFRLFKNLLEQRYGANEAKERIVAVTDKSKGTLKRLADAQGYETFVVPDDIGGRYSVLTAVGLLPIACAGFDIDKLMGGAAAAVQKYSELSAENGCYMYAALRNILLRKGKKVELFAAYEPRLAQLAEWFKQLYGESEGKDHKGIFPASAMFSTDLHSLGQFIQDGSRILFQTVLDVKNANDELFIEPLEDDFDGLNFLAGQNMSQVNRRAFEGTILAHTDGGTPTAVIEVQALDEHNIGELIYFFERACAISGYMLGVNPFDQPGVEEYKVNMFALLGKQGYEQRREELEQKIEQIKADK